MNAEHSTLNIEYPTLNPQPSTTDRNLKLTLSQGEFGVLNWAQRMATGGAHGVSRPTGLAPFARRALFEAVRRVIAEVANQGGRIPPGVAKDYETWKNET